MAEEVKNDNSPSSYASVETDTEYITAECQEINSARPYEQITDKSFRYRNVYVREKRSDIKDTTKDINNTKRRSNCDTCLSWNLQLTVASDSCVECEVYLCSECVKDHESHQTFTFQNGLTSLVDEVINEANREETISENEIYACTSINVSGGTDEEKSWITGFCFPGNNIMILCDYNNDCLKMIGMNTHDMYRYIRMSSGPWNATLVQEEETAQETTVKKIVQNEDTTESIEQNNQENVVTSDKSKTLDKEQILAVTCPDARQILILNISKKPAVKSRQIRVDGECFGIELFQDKFFTSLKEPQNNNRIAFHILDNEGIKLNIISTDFETAISPPYFVLLPEKEVVYFTSGYHGIVQCVDFNGKVLATFTDNGPGLRGLCMDDAENLYVCANNDDAIFKLSPDLEQCDVIGDSAVVRMKWPQAISLCRDQLFISHYARESEKFQNYVNVVRIL